MLINLKHRSNEVELMDNPNIEDKALQIALADISKVNKLLGGNAITIRAVNSMIKDIDTSKEIIIIDLGCGDGEMLRAIARIFRKKERAVKLLGIDLSKKSLLYAQKLSENYPEIQYMHQDLLEMKVSEFSCDIIISTLTLHHLTNEDIKKIMYKSLQLAKKGIIINDLHRSALAYYLFKIFSFFFIKGYVAKNDGLVSIKRAFKKQDLIQYAKDLNLTNYKITWKWAFRYRWIINNS
ncbi:methyltransferase domain-containing protein [Aquimarina algicola]|uniref:Methyltransferase domain-containing protein n=1 Tax=Aquimarina algicola TaxID=2589995 RepID=A0A504JDR3_9FLAO|nr:methyltransferase domain-containing protein [Aquimarina algicola]TPN88854.1 methyltransferase domain-containing protein [Aquimarina algicola]